MIAYQEFLAQKAPVLSNAGVIVKHGDVHPILYPFQRDLVRFACRKGRSAIFADTGLGKTFMQLEWARLIEQRTLIVAPLSVARQSVKEATKLGIDLCYARHQEDAGRTISITNYEMAEHFDPAQFGAVVLDESSILKALDGKTRQRLTEMFGTTPYRLCCTATPAPNDISEIANHAEFLGIMSRADMLATFFVHDDNGWRLKGHAAEPFYRWLASWGMSIRMPSDLGYEDDGYILPKLIIGVKFIDTDYRPVDALFFNGLKGIQDRAKVRKSTAEERCHAAAEMVNQAESDQWIVWCGLNDEGRQLHHLIADSLLMEGSQSHEEKATAIEIFQDRRCRVLVTKPRLAGFGLNLQNCHRMAFVGLSDSWESYYQCIRRCWRFGQTHETEAVIVLSEIESDIWENVKRKDREANAMRDALIKHVAEYEKAEIGAYHMSEWQYQENTVKTPDYTIMLGDSAERLREIGADSVGLSVFSPPFMSLYTYSPTERDIGNSHGEEIFFMHFGYIIDELMRITKPGRNCAVHVAQVPAMLARDGYIGLKDFRGKTIVAFEQHGWIYHGEACIDKDPQAQAIRTKSKGLLFTQMHKDSSWSRPALADYILVFRKPGENAIPIHPELTNDEWIEWARPIWYGIRESDTLNYTEAREEKDERHICPLQLGTIERVVRLWSNKDELVCSPFMGIGSEGYVAVKHNRRFVGCELKQSYFELAIRNLAEAAERQGPQKKMQI